MKSNYEVIPFENVARLEAITIGSLPTASLSDIKIDNVDDEHADKFKAVVNDFTHEVESIVSDKYLLVNHRQIFEPVVQAMKNLGINVNGKVIIDGGRIYADVFFDDPRLKIDVDRKVGDIVNFGMRFFNSYDKTSSFGAEIVALRLVCTNGMVKPIALKSIREVHTGKEKELVVKSIKKLFEALILECPNFADIVSRARQEVWNEKLLKELLTNWKLGEKHVKNILAIAEKVDELNGWTVYNCITQYVSRNLQVREKTRESWHKKYANKILTTPVQMLITQSKEAIVA